jgi:hypothetical protein
MADDHVAPAQDGGDVERGGNRLRGPGTLRASDSARAGRSNAFEGMHA